MDKIGDYRGTIFSGENINFVSHEIIISNKYIE